MTDNMKKNIAAAAMELLQDPAVKKLTVEDIVEACGITRQAIIGLFVMAVSKIGIK